MFGIDLEKYIAPVWNIFLNAVKEGNITVNVYSIPIRFGNFKVLVNPFVIDPPLFFSL